MMADNGFDRQLEDILRMHLPGVADDARVPMDAPLVDLGLDSLRAVSLVLDLEDSFGVEFPDQVLSEATFETGARIRDALRALVLTRDGADA